MRRRLGVLGWAAMAVGAVLAPLGPTGAQSREGLRVEHPAGRARLTLVRLDPARYAPRLLTRSDGPPRALPDWARAHGLVAAINAAMYEADGRATSLLVRAGVEESPDDARFGGLFAFDPRGAGAAPVILAGRDCEGTDLDALRRGYASLVASYRLLGCDGAPIEWQDHDRYTAAAVGVDRDGHVVLALSRAQLRMSELAHELAAPRLRIASIMFVEGGPEATLWADSGRRELLVTGRYASGEDPERPWPLPNVLGFVRVP